MWYPCGHTEKEVAQGIEDVTLLPLECCKTMVEYLGLIPAKCTQKFVNMKILVQPSFKEVTFLSLMNEVDMCCCVDMESGFDYASRRLYQDNYGLDLFPFLNCIAEPHFISCQSYATELFNSIQRFYLQQNKTLLLTELLLSNIITSSDNLKLKIALIDLCPFMQSTHLLTLLELLIWWPISEKPIWISKVCQAVQQIILNNSSQKQEEDQTNVFKFIMDIAEMMQNKLYGLFVFEQMSPIATESLSVCFDLYEFIREAAKKKSIMVDISCEFLNEITWKTIQTQSRASIKEFFTKLFTLKIDWSSFEKVLENWISKWLKTMKDLSTLLTIWEHLTFVLADYEWFRTTSAVLYVVWWHWVQTEIFPLQNQEEEKSNTILWGQLFLQLKQRHPDEKNFIIERQEIDDRRTFTFYCDVNPQKIISVHFTVVGKQSVTSSVKMKCETQFKNVEERDKEQLSQGALKMNANNVREWAINLFK